MATLTDYIVVQDGTFNLGNPGDSKTFTDPIPTNLVLGSNRARPIIAFKAWATPSGGRFEVEVNDRLIYSDQLTGGDKRVLWEVFSVDALRPGTDNTIQFRSVENALWFADVVLWFQVEV